MSTIRNKQGGDLCNDLSDALMRATGIAAAIMPKAGELLCPREFTTAAQAIADACAKWGEYLDADLRATIAAGEHLQAMGEALQRGAVLVVGADGNA